jgi:hypothetical protein
MYEVKKEDAIRKLILSRRVKKWARKERMKRREAKKKQNAECGALCYLFCGNSIALHGWTRHYSLQVELQHGRGKTRGV